MDARPSGRIAAGSRIGPYRIVRFLGRGGTSLVFEAARDPGGESVALKVLAPDLLRDAELVARFRREGRALSRLSHPGIARVDGAGEENGAPWLALELLAGGTLADRVRARGRLPWRDALAIGADLARALAHVHAAGLVHRDVKPGNVFLDGEGRPRLGDFGLVRGAGDTQGGLTREGEAVGTPEFLAPEQVDRAHEVDARADLYALGATLHVLLAGEAPFAGVTGASLFYAKLSKEPPPLRSLVPDLPADVSAVVERLLRREPAARGPGAAELARELDALVAGEKAAGSASAGRAGPPGRRALVVAALLALGAAGVLGRALGTPGGAPAPDATSVSTSPTSRPSPRPRRPASSPSPAPTPTPTPSPDPAFTDEEIEKANDAVREVSFYLALGRGSNEAQIVSLLEGVAPLASVHEARGRLHLKRLFAVEDSTAATYGDKVRTRRALAFREFQASIAVVATYAPAWLGIARALEAGGPSFATPAELVLALSAARQATFLDPQLADAWLVQSNLEFATHDDERGLATLRSGIELNPDRCGALHSSLASRLFNAKDYPGAEEECGLALGKDGEDLQALETLARTRLVVGRPADALGPAERLVAKRPDASGPLLLRGLARIRTGAHEEGCDDLRRAAKKAVVEYGDETCRIADACAETGERDVAKRGLDLLDRLEAAGTAGSAASRIPLIRAKLAALVPGYVVPK